MGSGRTSSGRSLVFRIAGLHAFDRCRDQRIQERVLPRRFSSVRGPKAKVAVTATIPSGACNPPAEASKAADRPDFKVP
jgi:hypothetical protein